MQTTTPKIRDIILITKHPKAKGKTGFILDHEETDRRDIYQIVLNKKIPNVTHNFNGLIQDKIGLSLEREHFIVKKHKDKIKQIQDKIYIFDLLKQIKERRNIKNRIRDLQHEITYYKQMIRSDKKQIKEQQKLLENKKTKKKKREEIIEQINQIKKLNKIKSIEIEDERIIIVTKDLKYRSKQHSIDNLDIGAFIIFIPFDYEETIKIINYKLQIQKEYFHPCIYRGNICIEQKIEDYIQKYRENNQLQALVVLLISFLEEPNSETLHISDYRFKFAQPVNIPFKKLKKYELLDKNINDMKFDSNKYSKDISKS